jgi:hypothetical protein
VDLGLDAEYIGAGFDDDRVYLLDRDGNRLWDYLTGGNVYSVSISEDGSYTVAGSDDDRVYFFNEGGGLLWSFTTGNDVRSVSISSDGGYVVAGSYDRIVYFFDKTGLLLWKYPMGERVNSVAVSPDGFYIAACAETKIRIFNQEGAVLWEFDSGATGRYVGVSSQGTPVGAEITSVALSSSASYLLIGTGSGDQKIYLYAFHTPVPVGTSQPPPFIPHDLQSFLHTSEEPSIEVAPGAYIVSVTNGASENGSATVQLAVPASWINSSSNRTVGIFMWEDHSAPVALETRFVGLDMNRNPVYEASAPTLNATFGAAFVHPALVTEPDFGKFLLPYMIPIAVTVIVAVASAGVWWIRRSRMKGADRQERSEEDELRALQESLKSLWKE